jgi:hypothetical protein
MTKKIDELNVPKKSDLEILEELSRNLKECGRLLDDGAEELEAEYERFLERERNANR